ncbi:hypothetical protein [Micromonospora sp. NPDC005324]|uniref:hypothetical protein n=1 Tax=Micromonospora sp. NPDC005324 TaxID=3157033 RepID=UPI0033B287AB
MSRFSVDGPGTDCVAFYASLPAADFGDPHVWRGPLSAVPELIEERGGPDFDLFGTKISGTEQLVEAVNSHTALETVEWPAQPR